MENTIDNKIKFFAQYFGQKVKCSYLSEQNGLNEVNGNCFHIQHLIGNGFLELKNISLIKGEDLKGLPLDRFFGEEYHITQGDTIFSKNQINIEIKAIKNKGASYFYQLLKAPQFDYLRSKGYALPWMDLSIEQQIEYGWIKMVN